VLTFDARRVNGGQLFNVVVRPKDAGGNDLITVDATAKYVVNIEGSAGAASDSTTLLLSSPVNGTTYPLTFNVKTWIEGRLNAGKTWADVAHVVLGFANGTGFDSPVCDWYVDNFR
jgi:hypothetical protein